MISWFSDDRIRGYLKLSRRKLDKIKKELGRGAMGVVYLAWHRDLGRPCVIKVVNPEKDTSGMLRQRFEREARETSLLRSPYTVQVFDFGITQQGQMFYVMEHLDGETLQDRLDRDGPQPFDIVCRWLVSSAESLAEAHARMLIHRDVKPANLFLAMTADGREVTKVLDFGIATKVEADPEGGRGKKNRDRNAAAGDSGPVGAQGPYHASGASGQAQATISGSARGGQDINININLTSSPGTNHDSSIRAHNTANDRADDSLDGSTDPLTCQFCGKYDEAFVDGDVLDLHYWKASFLYTIRSIPSVLCMRFFLSFFLAR